MAVRRKRRLIALLLGAVIAPGCSFNSLREQCGTTCYTPPTAPTPNCAAMAIEEPCLEQKCLDPWVESAGPLDITEEMISADNTLTLTLEQCIQMALGNSTVLRDLGGTLVRSPEAAGTFLDPALAFTDPRFGQEAALAEFDANFTASARFENNDRPFNNAFVGAAGLLSQDYHNYNYGVSKRSATGGQYAFRHVTLYDSNNQLSNRLGTSTFETYLEAEVRQPLFQGAGTEFNRIAGPNARPGNINGVLVARVRQDISLAEFQRNLRDLVADVENAYWDLYFAYRDLEAKIDVRDQALLVRNSEKFRSEALAGDAEQALEQYYRFQAEVVDSLNGRPLDATRAGNGSTGGTFRGQGGLRVAERRLRLIIGMAINDGRIIRPADGPTSALVTYDWDGSINEALDKRAELRRQRWVIKQRELELLANRNFLKPRVDVVGGYRFRGLGDRLLDQSGSTSAADSLVSGDFQEVYGGVEMLVPVGFRQANAAVRNSQQTLARERAILREQERYVHFGLSNAFSELRRAYDNRQLQAERLQATKDQIDRLTNRDNPPLDVLLEAQRRLLDIRLSFHRAEIEYALAIRNIQLEKGTLLEYCNVAMAESVWPTDAYHDANERARLRGPAKTPGDRDPVIATKSPS